MKDLRSTLTAAVALALLAPAFALAHDRELFSPLPSMIALDTSDPFLLAITNRPASITTLRVNANANAVDTQTESLRIALAPGIDITARRSEARDDADGTTVWWGRLEADDLQRAGLQSMAWAAEYHDVMNYVLLVRNGDMITGEVRAGGRIYEIRPLESGSHTLTEVDIAQLPPLHSDRHQDLASTHVPAGDVMTDTARSRPQGPGETLDARKTKILFLFTNRAQQTVKDPLGLAKKEIETINRSFRNSAINIVMEMAAPGIFHSDANEALPEHQLLRWLQGEQNTSKLRNDFKADVVALITDFDRGNGVCGSVANMKAREDEAYFYIGWQCVSDYGFVHELGHIYGAGHNPEANGNPNYAYGHGYLDPQGRFRTVMAYKNCKTGPCAHVPLWSSPTLFLELAPVGTANTHHNQRVVNERKAAVAAFR